MSDAPRSPSLAANPELDSWIRIEPDGVVTVFTGKVEIGQGIVTAIARIAAEELDVSLDRIRVHTADTAEGPDEFATAGSWSVEHSGGAVRVAAAHARQLLVEMAAEKLGIHASELEVVDGEIRSASGEPRVTYAELMAGKRFERPVSRDVTLKTPASYRLVGKPGPRIDLRDKLTGGAFLHDLRLPGMLHGRVARPPSLDAKLERVDLERVRKLPGVVAVVRDGRFLGVVADREEQAIRAREALVDQSVWVHKAWPEAGLEPDSVAFLESQPRVSQQVVGGKLAGRPASPHTDPPEAATTLAARYSRPYTMHASIGPAAALALEADGELTIWTHSQSVSPTRQALATALDRSPDTIRLIHRDGAGCYGHNGADDAVLDAALLARRVPGRPVMLQWMREDEHLSEPYGPAMFVDLRGSLDALGNVIDWNHEVTSFTHVTRPLPPHDKGSQLSAAWLLEKPKPRPATDPAAPWELGDYRNAWPYYEWPGTRVVRHLLTSQPVRTSALRALGAFANVFAIESFVDELAGAAGLDPVEFRLRHLGDRRARAVIETAAEAAGWGNRTGQGIAFARYENCRSYVALVVQVEVDAQGAIVLRRVVIAADAGQVVDPSGLTNQLEGGFVQAASWTLREAVRFQNGRVRSTDWDSYPILGFADIPEIETRLLDQPGAPFLGAGEATHGPTPAAIANAVFRASGVRLRQTPFTPERFRENR